MWLKTVVTLGAFMVLLLALLPRVGCEAVAIRWLRRLLRLLLALTVVACGASHLRPDVVPGRVALLLRATAEQIRAEMPAFAVAEGLLGSPWVVVALVAVVTGLPHLRALRDSLCGCRSRPHEGQDGGESCSRKAATGQPPPDGRPLTPRLLKDILDDPVSPC